MKKTLILLAAILGLFWLMSAAAYAAPEYDYGQDAIAEAVPDEAEELLEGENITPDSGAASLSFEGVIGWICSVFSENITAPLRLLVALSGIVLLCSVTSSVSDNAGDKLSGVFSVVGVLAGAGVTAAALSDIIGRTLELLSSASVFITVFIPIFAGILSVMGKATAASAINTVTLAATQLFSQLAVNFLAPFCGAIMGLSITGAVCPQLNISRLAELIKKAVTWTLSLLMTIFMSILSLQTFVTNSADSVLIRTAKFAVSSGVPLVGGTISDAVTTVHGGLALIKSSVGTYGVIAAAVIILPTLINVLCYRFALLSAETVSDIFGVKELSSLLKASGAVVSIIMAIIACFLLLNTIAAVIMLSMTGGTA